MLVLKQVIILSVKAACTLTLQQDSYKVHENERGLYMLGGLGDKLRLTECFTFTKELTGDVYAMCLGASFVKRADKESKE